LHVSFFFSSRRRHTRSKRDWSSDVCSSDLCLVPPSFAQRDPLDLAQAGFVAKDRGDFTVAIRLFDEALQRGLFADKQRGLLLYRSEERRVGKECSSVRLR